MSVDEIAARIAIRDLVSRYNLYGDTGRSDDVAQLFTEDGVLEYREGGSSERFTGRAEIVEFLERVKAQWIAESDAAGVSARVFHSVGTHVVDLLDDHAVGEAYVTVLRHDGLAEWGRYRDQYVFRDGRWSLAYRRASVDGRVVGQSLRRTPPTA